MEVYTMKRGFTLIELLIVVAIIAILAAIAVPNFLEAQTRSKVSRVKADLRSLATAIEAYAVDNNKVPREWNTTRYGDPQSNGQNVSGVLWWGISTPVAYITNPYMNDPFQDKNLTSPFDERIFTYQDMKTRAVEWYPTSTFWPPAYEFYGAWRMCSVGPDRSFTHNCPSNSAQLEYDPTNGTVSPGNIWRSQKNSGVQPPPPLCGCQ
jgi:prepilin-type N-terminal cleavage/methylation domain-containing protein